MPLPSHYNIAPNSGPLLHKTISTLESFDYKFIHHMAHIRDNYLLFYSSKQSTRVFVYVPDKKEQVVIVRFQRIYTEDAVTNDVPFGKTIPFFVTPVYSIRYLLRCMSYIS